MGALLSFSGMKFFSVYGLVAVLLLFIPNLVFAKKEQQGRVDDIDTCGFAVCLLEIIFRIVLVGALIFVRMPQTSIVFLIAAIVVLLLYYAVWIRYYRGGAYYPEIYTESFWGIPLPMTVFNCVYYILISLWLGNLIALCAALISGICKIENAKVARKDIRCRLLDD